MCMFQIAGESVRPLLHVVRTVEDALTKLGVQFSSPQTFPMTARAQWSVQWRYFGNESRNIQHDSRGYIGFRSWRNRRRKYLNRLRKLRATTGSRLRFKPYTLTHLVQVHLKNFLLGSARCPQCSQRNQSSPFCGAIGRKCPPSTQYGQRMIFCFFSLVVHWCKRHPPSGRGFPKQTSGKTSLTAAFLICA
jgi:hypothetical protein